jgi:membrane-associated phospholipid phosphatase
VFVSSNPPPTDAAPEESRPTWHATVRQELVHPSRSTLIRIALAILMVVIAVFTNRQFLGWGLFATLAILVVPLGRARSFAASFAPYAAVWFIFTFIRSLADETTWAQKVNTVASDVERWIFNGELPTIRLQAEFYDPFNLQWWDYYFTFVHWSYFLIPHAVAAFLWWKYPARFLQYLRTMTLTLTLGLVLYFALPSNPPWMAPESVNTPGAATALRIMEPIATAIGGGLYKAGYKIVGESNPIAAMPSIHMAITFILVPVSYWYGRTWRILAWVYAVSMGMALVYLGEHYVIDVVIGSLITLYSWYAGRTWMLEVFPAFRRFVQGRIRWRSSTSSERPAGTGA